MIEIKRIRWDEETKRPVVEIIQPSDFFKTPDIDDVALKSIRDFERGCQLKKNDDWYKSLKENHNV